MDALIQALRAAGEPTRLRILLVLEGSELTVTELCRILGQSQPRVSRHLKLLCDAGLLVRQAEGTSAYYRHARTPFAQQFLTNQAALVAADDALATRDRQQLSRIRAGRAELAARSSEAVASENELLRDRTVPGEVVERVMMELATDEPIDRLLDVGTGTGRVLELLAPHVNAGIGVELNRGMLNLARTRLDSSGLQHCTVRYGNAYNLDLDADTVGLAVLHHVLHFLDEPARAVEQAARTVRPGGRLLIVDFAPHTLEALRSGHGHRRLGFSDSEVIHWCERAGMTSVAVTHLSPPSSLDDPLTVTLWVARQPADRAADHPAADQQLRNLEVA